MPPYNEQNDNSLAQVLSLLQFAQQANQPQVDPRMGLALQMMNMQQREEDQRAEQAFRQMQLEQRGEQFERGFGAEQRSAEDMVKLRYALQAMGEGQAVEPELLPEALRGPMQKVADRRRAEQAGNMQYAAGAVYGSPEATKNPAATRQMLDVALVQAKGGPVNQGDIDAIDFSQLPPYPGYNTTNTGNATAPLLDESNRAAYEKEQSRVARVTEMQNEAKRKRAIAEEAERLRPYSEKVNQKYPGGAINPLNWYMHYIPDLLYGPSVRDFPQIPAERYQQ